MILKYNMMILNSNHLSSDDARRPLNSISRVATCTPASGAVIGLAIGVGQ